MARRNSFAGEIVTIAGQVKSSAAAQGGVWVHISGTDQAIADFLTENNIPGHKVRIIQDTTTVTTWHAWYKL